MLQIIQQVLEWVAQDSFRTSAAYALATAVVAGFFGFLAKRPIIRQAVEDRQFLTQIQGYRQLVSDLQSRISYYDSQMSIRDAYEGELIRRIRELEENSRDSKIESRWRHLVSSLMTHLMIHRRTLAQNKITAVPKLTGLEVALYTFEREGGEVQAEWRILIDDTLG